MTIRQHRNRWFRGVASSRGHPSEDEYEWGNLWADTDEPSDIWIHRNEQWALWHRGYSIQAWRSDAHTLGDAAWASLSFDREEADSDGDFSPTASQLLPTMAGYYYVYGSCAFLADAAGWRSITIKKNGLQYLATNMAPGDAAEDTHISISRIVYLNGSTDYVEIQVRQNSGGELDTVSTGDDLNNASRYCGGIALAGATGET